MTIQTTVQSSFIEPLWYVALANNWHLAMKRCNSDAWYLINCYVSQFRLISWKTWVSFGLNATIMYNKDVCNKWFIKNRIITHPLTLIEIKNYASTTSCNSFDCTIYNSTRSAFCSILGFNISSLLWMSLSSFNAAICRRCGFDLTFRL